ncbi:MAG TPA: hypothetical protein VFJ57_05235 [Solirubrobacterales bacterium]|nr:hypothetical protein [Solirubrobacterales bacterium]
MSLFRPTAHVLGSARKLVFLVALCLGLLGLFSSSALADSWHHGHWGYYGGHWDGSGKPASAKANSELAVCPGQTFSQPFLEFGDENFYTEAQDSDFDAGSGDWTLRNGARLVGATDPDGSAGGALELPAGAYAISPPVCVTLQYPTARAWVRTVGGWGGVTVSVYYAKAKYGLAAADDVGYLGSDGAWDLSDPFEVKPELAGDAEGTREVRFVFSNRTWSSVFDLSGLFVDPRMR